MKNKLTYPIFAFLVVLLASASFVTAVTPPPNANFETGDYFYFTSDGYNSNSFFNKGVLTDGADPNVMYRYNEWYNQNDETTEGVLEIFIIKPGVNLPEFTHPKIGAFDHLFLIDWEGMTVVPSTNSGYSNNFPDMDDLPNWENDTFSWDTSGRYYGSEDKDENAQPGISNSTYLMLFSEMTENSRDIENYFPPEMSMSSFDWLAPLTSRSMISIPSVDYSINGQINTLDTILVQSKFLAQFTETFPSKMPFGPDQVPIDVTTTFTIDAFYEYNYTFDASTGGLLEISEIEDVFVNVVNSNTSYYQPDGPHIAVDTQMSINSYRSSYSIIAEASSFYGNTRPISSGTNRIETGDLLVYDVESDREWSMDRDVVAGNPDLLGWESYDSSWGDHYSYGEMNFDVYRHTPGFFDAVMFSESQAEGSWGYDKSGTRFGQYHQEADISSFGPETYLDYDYMSFQSTDDEEIVHWFEPDMWFNDDFLYDEGDGDGWRLNYNRQLPMVGVVNDTTWHVDTEVGESVWINDFEHTWFNVQQYSQKYGTSYNQQVEIPLFRDENGEAWITVTLTGEARGEQSFFYDNQTGVLVRMEERMEVDLFLIGTGTFQYWDDFDIEHTLTATFDAVISIREKFSIMLSEHPHEYLTAEAADPVDHRTPTTADTTGEEPPALDLPISVPSIVMGIIAIPVLIRFKKKLR